MIIAQRTGDVWNILRAVRTQFKKYNDTVGRVAKQLNTAAGSVADLGKRAEMMDRALQDVETMPDDGSAAKMLGIPENIREDENETEDVASSLVSEAGAPIIVSEAMLEGRGES
jgi:DNA recombination protein RmuC